MPTKKTRSQDIYQIKVTLLGVRPPIWRRLLVSADMTLAQLHDVLQPAMGWEDYHLHEFHIGQHRYGIPDPDDMFMGGDPCIPERSVRLSDVLGVPGAEAKYTYDFGDGWEHGITVEKVLPPDAGLVLPVCTDGKRHGPPEDCGGPFGYETFLEAIRDPEHEEHEDMLTWIGGSFDPESFSAAAVSSLLRKRFRPTQKKTAKSVAAKRKAAAGPAVDAAALLSAILNAASPPQIERKRIRVDETVPLDLDQQERELILEHTLADSELTNRLLLVPKPGEPPTYRFTLGDLDDLAGFVAAEANHATNKKLQKQLDRLFDKMQEVLNSFTDDDG